MGDRRQSKYLQYELESEFEVFINDYKEGGYALQSARVILTQPKRTNQKRPWCPGLLRWRVVAVCFVIRPVILRGLTKGCPHVLGVNEGDSGTWGAWEGPTNPEEEPHSPVESPQAQPEDDTEVEVEEEVSSKGDDEE